MTRFSGFLLHIAACTVVLVLTSFILTSSIFAGDSQYELPILMYHHILPEADNTLFRNESVITPERFEQQIQYLYNRGYETVTTEELYGFLYNGKQLSGNKVMLTFDDGYLSNYKYAYDILKKYKYTAVVFVITSKIAGAPVEFDPNKLTMFSIPEMEASRDVFEFGSHSHNMHWMDDDGLAFILFKPLTEVGADISTSFTYPHVKKIFAYPFGDFNKDTVKILKERACGLAFTNRNGYATKYTDAYMIPRFTISGDMPIEKFKAIFERAVN